MNTLETLYQTVMSNRHIMGEFVKASGTDQLAAFAERYGCAATDSEIRSFFSAKCEGEIPDDTAADITAGCKADLTRMLCRILCCKQPA